MENAIPLEKVLKLAKRLSPKDRSRLIVQIAPQIERDLKTSPGTSLESLRGRWRSLDITDEDQALQAHNYSIPTDSFLSTCPTVPYHSAWGAR
jgi:hypothetical protein